MGEKVQVCVPLAGPMAAVPAPFVISLPSVVATLHNIPGVDGRRFNFDSHFPLDCNRNHQVKAALEWGADWTLWLDCDMSFPDDLVPSLFAVARQHKAKIVSGLYFKKRPPFLPVAMVKSKTHAGFYNSIDPVTCPNSAVRVDLIGMGCALIHTDVFRALPDPWFFYKKKQKTGWLEVSEDVAFCESAREAGFDILVHTGMICPHYTTASVGLDHWVGCRETLDQYPTEET